MVAPGCAMSPAPSCVSMICSSGTANTGVKFANFVPSSGVWLLGFIEPGYHRVMTIYYTDGSASPNPGRRSVGEVAAGGRRELLLSPGVRRLPADTRIVGRSRLERGGVAPPLSAPSG